MVSRPFGVDLAAWGYTVLVVDALGRLADYMAEQTGIRVEGETVRRHPKLKDAEIVLSRPRHTITP